MICFWLNGAFPGIKHLLSFVVPTQGILALFHSDKIAKPLKVLRGMNDQRVLKAEPDEIVVPSGEKVCRSSTLFSTMKVMDVSRKRTKLRGIGPC